MRKIQNIVEIDLIPFVEYTGGAFTVEQLGKLICISLLQAPGNGFWMVVDARRYYRPIFKDLSDIKSIKVPKNSLGNDISGFAQNKYSRIRQEPIKPLAVYRGIYHRG